MSTKTENSSRSYLIEETGLAYSSYPDYRVNKDSCADKPGCRHVAVHKHFNHIAFKQCSATMRKNSQKWCYAHHNYFSILNINTIGKRTPEMNFVIHPWGISSDIRAVD